MIRTPHRQVCTARDGWRASAAMAEEEAQAGARNISQLPIVTRYIREVEQHRDRFGTSGTARPSSIGGNPVIHPKIVRPSSY